ncbi:MAG: carboxypeptidase regulatory-like domain-containing protein [Nitrospirae bacterium]|nr:carboxypeptidase regulatory-like domain-containing protein [Nitrospirota bacterium]
MIILRVVKRRTVDKGIRFMRAMNSFIVAAAFAGIVFFGIGSFGWGYDEIVVSHGGTLSGKVMLQGTRPPTRIFHLIFSPNIDFCGKVSDGKANRLLKEFEMSEDGGFRNVVVAVVGVKAGKKFDYNPELTIDTCRIGPFVTSVRNHHPITLVNKDPIAHDIQGYSLQDNYTFAMFNKPIVPNSTAVKPIELRNGHYIFRTQCGVHDFMQSWGMAVGNPYFSVTGPDGSFSIPDLPPGTYDVIAWHPYMKVQARQVTIPADGKAAMNFQFDAAQVDIPLYGFQTGYRLETALIPLHPIEPSIELQLP